LPFIPDIFLVKPARDIGSADLATEEIAESVVADVDEEFGSEVTIVKFVGGKEVIERVSGGGRVCVGEDIFKRPVIPG
jgi:hypothetical protein